jgi:hypothetical protein
VYHMRCPDCQRTFTSPHHPDKIRLVCKAKNAGGTIQQQQPAPPTHGPGTELKALLGKLGIQASENCKCNRRAREMDERGTQWCRDNLDAVLDWLAEESRNRKIPFVRQAARIVVKMAIRNAEKKNCNG